MGVGEAARAAGLIDDNAIACAREARVAAGERVVSAASEVDAAREAHGRAKRGADLAAAGTMAEAMDAEHALEAAARALRVAERVHQEATLAVPRAEEALRLTVCEANRPVYLRGISLRLAAARKADAARAMLAEAQADHDHATEHLNFASRAGTQHVIYDGGHGAGRPVGTLADETALWSRRNGWWMGDVAGLETAQ